MYVAGREDAKECEGTTMLKARILLLSSLIPAGAWAASANADQSRLIFQVVCAIVVSFVMFVLVLRATEHAPGPQRIARTRWSERSALPSSSSPRVRRVSAMCPAHVPNPKYLRPVG
jgi:hypothetical protein